MTEEFLEFSQAAGNDLSTPIPEYGFPGLNPSDQWCLCAARWKEALEAGADSYLLKNTPSAELIESIRSAARGRRQLSPELLDSVLEEFGGLAREKTVRDADLSDEDLRMLTLASEGATNREIGVALNRSEIAVKKRLQVVFQKLDVNDRAHAVAEALRRGLI